MKPSAFCSTSCLETALRNQHEHNNFAAFLTCANISSQSTQEVSQQHESLVSRLFSLIYVIIIFNKLVPQIFVVLVRPIILSY